MDEKYFVSVVIEKGRGTTEEMKTIDDLADEYLSCGRNVPKMGLPYNENAHEGDYAYLFSVLEKSGEFWKDVFNLDYVKKVIIGKVAYE